MNKHWKTVAAIVIALLMPAAAYANMYVPSFVQILTSPLLWSIYLVTTVITIPTIFGIAAIEALVLRKYVKTVRFRQLVGQLATINAITSLLGTVTLPTGTELWPGIPIAFALTVIVETLMLFIMVAKNAEIRSKPRLFKASIFMNTVSYAVLTAVLACLIYLPLVGHEDGSIRQRVTGMMVLIDYPDGAEVLDLTEQPRTVTSGYLLGNKQACYTASSKSFFYSINGGHLEQVSHRGVKWSKQAVNRPKEVDAVYGVSPDGSLLCCRQNEQVVIYDLVARKVQRENITKPGALKYCAFSYDQRYFAWQTGGISFVMDLRTGKVDKLDKLYGIRPFHFSPVSAKLAWSTESRILLYDCARKKKTSIHIPGNIAWDGNICWSYDGEYVAYIGHPSPYATQRFTPDVRVIDVDTGKSTTVYHHLSTGGRPSIMFWLPKD